MKNIVFVFSVKFNPSQTYVKSAAGIGISSRDLRLKVWLLWFFFWMSINKLFWKNLANSLWLICWFPAEMWHRALNSGGQLLRETNSMNSSLATSEPKVYPIWLWIFQESCLCCKKSKHLITNLMWAKLHVQHVAVQEDAAKTTQHKQHNIQNLELITMWR